MKILVATEKPFAKKAVDGIRQIVEGAGYELALLEKYTDKSELLSAVADVDALIIRSDKVTAEVSDLPPPVGMRASVSRPAIAERMIRSCTGRNSVKPQ